MGPHEAPHLAHAENLWFDWFRDGTLNSDIDDAGMKSVLHYLLDLNVMKFQDDAGLQISGVKTGQTNAEVRSFLLIAFDKLKCSENGFAIVYFLSGLSENGLPPLKLEISSPGSERKSIFGQDISGSKEKSSDLSNLQIVKKWGNQLRPYLDLEQQTIARLRGTHTSQEDAQWMFSYILNKTAHQAPAKKWEQLSRKRHR
jgi:hypothetical protein